MTSLNIIATNFNDLMSRPPFKHVKRIPYDEVADMGKLVHETVMVQSSPLIVDKWHKSPAWNGSIFKLNYLKTHYGTEDIVCRDVNHNIDVEMKMKDFIDHIRKPSNGSDTGSESLLYGKDLSCPEKWRESIMDELLPPIVAYRGPNDLNAFYPEKAAETLMLYIGKEGTRTPLHYNHCGTVGHNILLHSDDNAHSIWFMIAAEDKTKAELLFKSLGYPLERESHFASVEQLTQAEFPIYVVEQRVGDLVLIPSLTYHQVLNVVWKDYRQSSLE
ncbi:hypothetical protein MVEG_08313 [Podila verticillata NRRL 6337]|nr:hypothetical protein MVEG_08313 [Podila verticillata NRRL 6337]